MRIYVGGLADVGGYQGIEICSGSYTNNPYSRIRHCHSQMAVLLHEYGDIRVWHSANSRKTIPYMTSSPFTVFYDSVLAPRHWRTDWYCRVRLWAETYPPISCFLPLNQAHLQVRIKISLHTDAKSSPGKLTKGEFVAGLVPSLPCFDVSSHRISKTL
jgi:hypothetical protein